MYVHVLCMCKYPLPLSMTGICTYFPDYGTVLPTCIYSYRSCVEDGQVPQASAQSSFPGTPESLALGIPFWLSDSHDSYKTEVRG